MNLNIDKKRIMILNIDGKIKATFIYVWFKRELLLYLFISFFQIVLLYL
jgi:hypothetical protein